MNVNNLTPKAEAPLAFFGLTLLLSLPFYILNALAHFNIVGQPELGALYIAGFTVAPVAAASILKYRMQGNRGVKKLLGRAFDFARIEKIRWYVVILLLWPLLHLLSVGGLSLFRASLPAALTPLVALPLAFVFLFVLAAGEELGWMGFAFEPLQSRHGAIRAALILGLFWAFWHVPFFVFLMPDRVVFSAHLITLVGTRVLVAWVYNHTGKSVFAAIVFHAADNAAFISLPNVIPWGAGLHCCLVLIAAFVVSYLWGPRTLARFGSRSSRADKHND